MAFKPYDPEPISTDVIPLVDPTAHTDVNSVVTWGSLPERLGTASDSLPAAVTLNSADITAISQSTTKRKATLAQIRDFSLGNARFVGKSGDASGATDGTAIVTAMNDVAAAGGGRVFLDRGRYFTGSTVIQIPANVQLIGQGSTATLIRGGTVSNVVKIGTGSGFVIGAAAKGFSIGGNTGGVGLKTDGVAEVFVDDVRCASSAVWPNSGDQFSGTYGFEFFGNTIDSSLLDLSTDGALCSSACFRTQGNFFANRCGKWTTQAVVNAAAFQFIGARACHWDVLVVQAGTVGLDMNGCNACTIGSVYSEAIAIPIIFGGLYQTTDIKIGSFFGPGFANQCDALIWYQNAYRCNIESVFAYGIAATSALISSSGGGGTGLKAIPIISKEGVCKAVAVINGGSGYTSDPTISLSGSGSGATFSVTRASGVVTAITVTAGGSGYERADAPLLAYVYDVAVGCEIGSVSIQGNWHALGAYKIPAWPFVAKRAAATSPTIGVKIRNDIDYFSDASVLAPASFCGVGNSSTAMIESVDVTGARTVRTITVPTY